MRWWLFGALAQTGLKMYTSLVCLWTHGAHKKLAYINTLVLWSMKAKPFGATVHLVLHNKSVQICCECF